MLDDLVRHRSGRSTTLDRDVACVTRSVTLLVNIARVHSRLPAQQHFDGGSLVTAAHVHGPYIVQVFLQQRRRGAPADLSTVRALAADPRLRAGI